MQPENKYFLLFVRLPCNVQEESDLVLRDLAAHVALEGVAVAVVAHVDRVHHGVGERQVTELAHVVSAQGSAGFRGLFPLLLGGLELFEHVFEVEPGQEHLLGGLQAGAGRLVRVRGLRARCGERGRDWEVGGSLRYLGHLWELR